MYTVLILGLGAAAEPGAPSLSASAGEDAIPGLSLLPPEAGRACLEARGRGALVRPADRRRAPAALTESGARVASRFLSTVSPPCREERRG